MIVNIMFKKHTKNYLINLLSVLVKIETKGLFLDTNEATSTFSIIELFESPSCKMCTGIVRSNNSGTTNSLLHFSELEY